MNFAEIQKALDAIKTAYDEVEYKYEEAIVYFIKAFLKEHNGEYNFDTSCVISASVGGEIDIAEVASIYIDDVDKDTIMVDTYKYCVDLRSLNIRDMESIVSELKFEIDDEEEL